MFFYDESYDYLPQNGQYYFNILVICIAINTLTLQEILPKDIIDFWYIEQINSPFPYIVHIYQEDLSRADYDWELVTYPHQVVEIKDAEISFYDMIDFDTEHPWRID